MSAKDPMAKVFYVYALIDPREGLPFYIGKGKGRRCRDHEMEWRTGKSSGTPNHRKLAAIEAIIRAGLVVTIEKIADGLNEYEAMSREAEEISYFRKELGRKLTNIMPGERCDAERNLADVNRNLSQFRTPEQYVADKLRRYQREPTDWEWRWYFWVLSSFAELKQMFSIQMRERHGEEVAKERGAW